MKPQTPLKGSFIEFRGIRLWPDINIPLSGRTFGQFI